MSEVLLNKHRPTSMEEPSDEMLAQIIHEVAVEAEESTEKARKKNFLTSYGDPLKNHNNVPEEIHKPILIVIAGPNG